MAAQTAVDTYYADERNMWTQLKATAFYASMHVSVSTGGPLPFESWLRMLIQVPGNIAVGELARIFDEEDTVTALSTVCPCIASTQTLSQPPFKRVAVGNKHEIREIGIVSASLSSLYSE